MRNLLVFVTVRPAASTAVARTTYFVPVDSAQRLRQVVDVESSLPATGSPPAVTFTVTRVPSLAVTLRPCCGLAWRRPFPGVMENRTAETVGLELGEVVWPGTLAAHAHAARARPSAAAAVSGRRPCRRQPRSGRRRLSSLCVVVSISDFRSPRERRVPARRSSSSRAPCRRRCPGWRLSNARGARRRSWGECRPAAPGSAP